MPSSSILGTRTAPNFPLLHAGLLLLLASAGLTGAASSSSSPEAGEAVISGRYARASPLRWGKRSDVLRWGKREPLRWGKRSVSGEEPVEEAEVQQVEEEENMPRMVREAPLRSVKKKSGRVISFCGKSTFGTQILLYV